MPTLADAIEGALGGDDETTRAWISEARRLEVQLDEAITVGDRLCGYAEGGRASAQMVSDDTRHWRELSRAVR